MSDTKGYVGTFYTEESTVLFFTRHKEVDSDILTALHMCGLWGDDRVELIPILDKCAQVIEISQLQTMISAEKQAEWLERQREFAKRWPNSGYITGDVANDQNLAHLYVDSHTGTVFADKDRESGEIKKIWNCNEMYDSIELESCGEVYADNDKLYTFCATNGMSQSSSDKVVAMASNLVESLANSDEIDFNIEVQI